MADDPIKFRCYRCGKLLGASPRKAGSVVECPRCRAEIEVPALSAVAPGPAAVESALPVSEESADGPDFAAIVATPVDVADADVPAIQIDPTPPAAAATTAPAPRAADVVLPPGVVMAWSLLVLLAVPLAFVAGLLLGHFVWK